MPLAPNRPRATLLTILILWAIFYASFTLVTPPLLDDADSVHAEVAREMLLRHDYVTLYANGIRYLEKAPLLYWSMAASMKAFQLAGATTPDALAAAARLPLAFTILALALLVEAFARRAFNSTRAGLYAALIILSSFGIFIFTRITIPDAAVCLWTTLALYFFWRGDQEEDTRFRWRAGFAIACALNVLTKGLIGVVFPVAIALLYLVLTRGLKGTWARFRPSHEVAEIGLFFLLAAPWHIMAGLANPTAGHPAPFHFINGHWQVPLPTDGNVRGWFWFYFMNEHLLRYLNLRVPHDYDTAPLYLFWGLCFIWMMPWSAFIFRTISSAIPLHLRDWRSQLRDHTLSTQNRSSMLLAVWAAVVLLFFSLSTRQEYYVLPALPALAILIAAWLSAEALPQQQTAGVPHSSRGLFRDGWDTSTLDRANLRVTTVLLALGTLFAIAATYFLLHTKSPAPNTDLAQLLAQNPGDYALSMGHFLDLNAQALGLFRLPLALAALSLFFGPLASLLLRRRAKPRAATLALAAGAFGFLLAAHLGLRTFSPVLTSAHLAKQIAPQVHPGDLIVIHGEYEAGSTLGFYLQRPNEVIAEPWGVPKAPDTGFIHILEGRSSNLWYGSFFPDARNIFETPATLAQKWPGPQRIFLWQSISLTDAPKPVPLPGPVYIIATGGGKEIVSNQPSR